MTAPPEALRVARRWIAKADEDIAAAERLLALDDSLAAAASFHSQQAVEKLIKGLLVLAGVSFPRTHDLIGLSGLLPEAFELAMPLSDLALLNRYAVETRYPIGEEPITGEEARAALAVAQSARAVVEGVLARVAGRI